MNFEITSKNISLDETTKNAISKATNRINKVLRGLRADEETGFITIHKHEKPDKYSAHINFQLPGKLLSAKDFGFTLDEALHKASLDARDQIIKLKDRLKDPHEKRRRAKPQTNEPEDLKK